MLDLASSGTGGGTASLDEFDRLIGEASEEGGAGALESASALYRGDLLQSAYYGWAAQMQSHFEGRFLDVLVKLSDERLQNGDAAAAITALRRVIGASPQANVLTDE